MDLVVKLISIFMTVSVLSCSKEGPERPRMAEACVSLDPGVLLTRSSDPQEETISNVNLFVFNSDGDLEERRYLDSRKNGGRIPKLRVGLLTGVEYTLAACVNFSYEIKGISKLEDLKAYRYHLAYPDEYREGIPMTGMTKVTPSQQDTIVLRLERMMSKINVRIDRNGLESGVRFNVARISVRHSPRSAKVFGESKAEGSGDTFAIGFMKSGREADVLNMEEAPGLSRALSLYMMENMQGDLPDGNDSCSYIQIEAEYVSEEMHTLPGEYLIYRFYLGERKGNFDIERNCQYDITVRPEGDGLTDAGWRTDRSGLANYRE